MGLRGLLIAVFLCTAPAAQGRDLLIITDIAPVTALAQAVVRDLHAVQQLIATPVSPHDFALKPSDIRRLEQADVILWLGPQATPALAKLMIRPDLQAKSVDLSAVDGVTKLPLRRSGLFQGQTPRDALDPHLWLDPANGLLWTAAIATALSQADPENASAYQANKAAAFAGIAAAKTEISTLLGKQTAPVFVQYHDGFQYFERAFGLSATGAATAEDEETTSLGILSGLRAALAATAQSCVFVRDPEQEKRALPLLEISGVRTGRVDPIGRGLDAGAYTYPALLLSVGQGFAGCFAATD